MSDRPLVCLESPVGRLLKNAAVKGKGITALLDASAFAKTSSRAGALKVLLSRGASRAARIDPTARFG